MIILLRFLFSAVIATMLGATIWASTQVALFEIPREIILHPWFLTTLLDAYWAFITFFVWVAWKEQRVAAGVLWFIAIVLLGNFALASYMLMELSRIPASGPLAEVFTRRNPGRLALPGALVAAAVGVYLLA